MSRLDDLMQKLCPDGVVFRRLWEVTNWDKNFQGVEKFKQPKTIKYSVLLANQLDEMIVENGDIRLLYTGSKDNKYTNKIIAGDKINEGEIIAIPWGGTPRVQYFKGKFVTGDNRIATSCDIDVLDNKFLYYWLVDNLEVLASFYRGSGIQHPSMKEVLDMRIPVPPLKVQQEIVRILDNFTELTTELTVELNARQEQYQYYRDNLLKFETTFTRKFGDIAKISRGASPRPIQNFVTQDKNGVSWIKIGDVLPNSKYVTKTNEKITQEGARKSKFVKIGDFILSNSMSFGRPYIMKINGCIHDGWLSISDFENTYTPDFLYHLISSNKIQIMMSQKASNGTVQNLNAEIVKSLEFPTPPLEEQQRIVDILDKFDKLVNDISEGIPAEIAARQKQYEYYRDKLLTFKEVGDESI